MESQIPQPTRTIWVGEQDSFFSQSDLFLPPNRTLIFFLLDFFPKVDVYWFS